jgi:predicted DNA-binding protein
MHATLPKEMCTFRLPVKTLQWLEAAHQAEDRTKTAIVKKALEEHLAEVYPQYEPGKTLH